MMERTSICAACAYYGVGPVSLSVDPACQSKDEADRLCVVHRARCTEGMCVLCGRREPWASPWEKSDVGACERCYRVLFGEELADDVAAEFARERRSAAGAACQLECVLEGRPRNMVASSLQSWFRSNEANTMNRREPSGSEDDTRKVRFKEILVVDQDETWALVMRDAVAGGGFCVSLASTMSEAIRKIREKRPDLVLLSCLMNPEESQALLGELDSLPAPPPMVLVGLATGDARWDAWKARSNVSLVRQPFKSRQLLEIALALLGTTWEELTGDAPRSVSD